MKVSIAEKLGFCFGVKRAVEMADQLEKDDCILGDIVHNQSVIQKLQEKGIKTVNSVSEVKRGKMLIRAHGTTKKTIMEAEEKGLEVINATCPFVSRAQKIAGKMHQEGYKVIVAGKKEHPEVIGIVNDNPEIVVFSNVEDIQEFPHYDTIGVLSQTTQTQKNFDDTCKKLGEHCDEIIKTCLYLISRPTPP